MHFAIAEVYDLLDFWQYTFWAGFLVDWAVFSIVGLKLSTEQLSYSIFYLKCIQT